MKTLRLVVGPQVSLVGVLGAHESFLVPDKHPFLALYVGRLLKTRSTGSKRPP